MTTDRPKMQLSAKPFFAVCQKERHFDVTDLTALIPPPSPAPPIPIITASFPTPTPSHTPPQKESLSNNCHKTTLSCPYSHPAQRRKLKTKMAGNSAVPDCRQREYLARVYEIRARLASREGKMISCFDLCPRRKMRPRPRPAPGDSRLASSIRCSMEIRLCQTIVREANCNMEYLAIYSS